MSWGKSEDTTRYMLEMAICYSDGTWKAGFFVEVEDHGECCGADECCHTEEERERLEKLGSYAIFDKFPNSKESGKHFLCTWLYDYPGTKINKEVAQVGDTCEQQFAQPGDTIEVTCAGIFLSGQKLIVVSKPEEDTVSDTVEHVWARIEGDDCHPVIMNFGSYRVVEESKWRKSQKIDNLLRKQMNANLRSTFE